MSRTTAIARIGSVLAIGVLTAGPLPAADTQHPNVLFIVVDDLNDWTTLHDPDNPIRTPNLLRLAARGTTFTHAYCTSPACNPSRVATLTGLHPSASGVTGNASPCQQVFAEHPTLPRHFRDHGYHVAGAGKIFHHHGGLKFHDASAFDDFQPMPHPPDRPMPGKKLNALPGYGSPNTDWGAWPPDPEDSVDHRTATYAANFLTEYQDGKPFFLAVGIFRPHMPFFAPQEFLDRFPADTAVLPTVKDDDRTDLPSGARTLLAKKRWFWDGMQKAERARPGTWSTAVRAYQAAAAYADHQLGRVLDALDASGHAGDTVVVLWSDHGFHLGEKQHIEKFALWEKTTRIPFVVVAPGTTRPGTRCDAPVDLLALYPTLARLCNIPDRTTNDGHDLSPLLRDPDAPWPHPALTSYLRDNHAVRTRGFRYIRYADGSEELYDHRLGSPAHDPHEHHNRAPDPAYAGHLGELRQALKQSLPTAPARDTR